MNEDSCALAAEHSMRHVGATIAVAVANSKDTRLAGAHSRVDAGVDLAVFHGKIEVGGDGGALLTRVVGDESVTVDGRPVGEVYTEDVELMALVIAVVFAALNALEGRDGGVLQAHVVGFQLLFPIGVLGGQLVLGLRRVRAIEEGNNVLIQGVDFQDAADDVGQAAEDAEGLVAVLVSIAPGTPIHALAPGLLKTGGEGEHIHETGAEDEFPGGVDGTVSIGGVEVGSVGGLVGDGRDIGDSLVHERSRVIFRDLLAGKTPELAGDSA